jgi:hypothetical protein
MMDMYISLAYGLHLYFFRNTDYLRITPLPNIQPWNVLCAKGRRWFLKD